MNLQHRKLALEISNGKHGGIAGTTPTHLEVKKLYWTVWRGGVLSAQGRSKMFVWNVLSHALARG